MVKQIIVWHLLLGHFNYEPEMKHYSIAIFGRFQQYYYIWLLQAVLL